MEENKINGEKKSSASIEYLDIAAVMILKITRDGKIGLINKKGREILGYNNESDLLGKSWVDTCIPEEQRVKVREVLKKSLNKDMKFIQHYENEVLTKSGEIKLIEWFSSELKDSSGKIIGSLSSGTDITDKKKAEKKIKKTAEEWESTFNAIPDLVSIHDKDSKIIRANKAFLEAFGPSKEKIIGQKCYSLIHGSCKHIDNCPAMKARKKKGPEIIEYYEPKLNAHLEISANPILDNKGTFQGVVHIIRNITERRKIEEDIKCKTSELESFNSLAVGRELKMIELKKEINDLSKKLNLPLKYSS